MYTENDGSNVSILRFPSLVFSGVTGQIRSTAHQDFYRVSGDLQWAKVGLQILYGF